MDLCLKNDSIRFTKTKKWSCYKLLIIKCIYLSLIHIYCWNRIRYYENLIKYTDDVRFSNEYIAEKEAYRDTVMSLSLIHI